MLDYTLQYVKNYQGINKFAHIMSLPGHEDTGTVIETLDQDLPAFLDSVLNTDDEVMIFFMADHGMRYGEWFKLIDGSHEHKLPMLVTITSTSLLKDIPNSLDNLYHNSNRLISKLDLHRTLKHLSYLPYYRGYTKQSPEYQYWDTVSPHALSLFLDKVPNSRNCEDVDIPPYFCSCLVFHGIPMEVLEGDGERNVYARNLIGMLANEVVYSINLETHTPYKSHKGHVCRKVSFNEIHDLQWLRLSSSRHFYKLILSVKESPLARFEAVVLVSSSYLRPRSFEQGYFVTPYYSGGKRVFRIMYIKRQDAYAGLCEDICRLKQIQPPLCICERLERITYFEPGIIQTLKSNYEFGISTPGQSCTDYCKSKDENCNFKGLNLLNTCTDLMKVGQCSRCYEGENQLSLPGLISNECYITKQNSFDCDASHSSISRGCACELHQKEEN